MAIQVSINMLKMLNPKYFTNNNNIFIVKNKTFATTQPLAG